MSTHTVHVSVLKKDFKIQGRTIDAYNAIAFEKKQAELQAETMKKTLKKSENVADDAASAVAVYDSGLKMINQQLDFIQQMLELSDSDAKKLWELDGLERQILVKKILGYAEGKTEEQVEDDVRDLKSDIEEQTEASKQSGNKETTN